MKFSLIYLSFCVSQVFTSRISYSDQVDEGPSNWDKINKQCGGRTQSPINIETKDLIHMKLSPIKLSYFTKEISAIKLSNNGHGFKMEFSFKNPSENYFDLKGTRFILDSCHLHWGVANSNEGGSEHTINDHRYAAEVHLVHYNKKYGSVFNALPYGDGLAVIGIFMEFIDSNKKGGKEYVYIKYLKNIIKLNSKFIINVPHEQHITMKDIIRHEITNYYFYKGSLTTPPCSPIVQWIISKHPISIFSHELEELNKIESDSGPLRKNFRPTQNVGVREVFSSV